MVDMVVKVPVGVFHFGVAIDRAWYAVNVDRSKVDNAAVKLKRPVTIADKGWECVGYGNSRCRFDETKSRVRAMVFRLFFPW